MRHSGHLSHTHTHTHTYPQCLTFTLDLLPHSSFGFRHPSCSPLHLKLQSKREGAKMKECYARENAPILYLSVCLTTSERKSEFSWYIMQHFLATKGSILQTCCTCYTIPNRKYPSKLFIQKLTSGVFPLLKQEKMANCFLRANHLKHTP